MTSADIVARLPIVVALANLVPGPVVCRTEMRGYGLFADRDYAAGEVLTTYEGHKTTSVRGDYLAYCGDGVSIDGSSGFSLQAKGRWLNEWGRDRSVVHATLGRTIRAAVPIVAGQEIFVDYGVDYDRHHYPL